MKTYIKDFNANFSLNHNNVYALSERYRLQFFVSLNAIDTWFLL